MRSIVVLLSCGLFTLCSASFYPYEEPSLRSEDKVYLPHLDPIALDSLMHEAKDIVVGRRKLEQDLVRHGRFTDMTKRTAVTRHQAVTTTFNTANALEKNQEVFEEMTKLIARKLVTNLTLNPHDHHVHPLMQQLMSLSSLTD